MPFLSPSAFAIAMPSVMPMSSTVWCASMSRSPLAFTSRSSPPWRASWSSMWSRKGMPEARRASPWPSRSTATRTWVSLVSRWISALRMGVSAEGGGECLEHSRVLVGSSDREPQAVGEQGMRAVECADQYTTLPQGLEGAQSVGHAHEEEVRRGGKALDAAQAVDDALEPRALVEDRRGLLLENVAMGEEDLRRRGVEGAHVVGHAQLLEFADPFARPHGEAHAQSREAELGNGAHQDEVRVPAHVAEERRPSREGVVRLVDRDQARRGGDDAQDRLARKQI